MKKIMFNDKYGLTDAVLQGRKTMTRRLVPIKEAKRLDSFFDSDDWDYAKQTCIDDSAAYMIGETIAVAQSYKDLGYTKKWVEQHIKPNPNAKCTDPFEKKYPGWNNKMFVSAAMCKHQIRITDIKAERLQAISDDDCFKEGIIPITWRQHLPQDFDDLSPQKHIDHNVYSLEKFREGIEDCWAESDPNEYMAEDAKTAFAVLIIKMYGRKVLEQNPYVFAYTFELVK